MLPEYKNSKRPGRALIAEGGGMRGAFVGGVLSGMGLYHPAENFDLIVGVSSGSCSAAYYATSTATTLAEATQYLMVWRHELSGSRLISLGNFLKGRTFLNQEYLVDELFGERYPLKKERLFEKDCPPFYIVVSNLKTNRAEYIKADGANILPLLKAATSLPLATQGKRRLGDRLYTDGGVLDPLPIKAVLAAGYTDLTVLLTNPRTHVEKPVSRMLGRLCFPRFPEIARALHQTTHIKHREAYKIAMMPPPGVRVTVIDPPARLPISMIGSDALLLNHSVDIGYQRALEIYAGQKRESIWTRLRYIFSKRVARPAVGHWV